MKDQAEQLRRRLSEKREPEKKSHTIAVASGKGGVGKSNFTLNFALSVAKEGQRVLLLDLDIGMGNIEVLLGESSKLSIVDFFERRAQLSEIIQTGPYGLSYITGGSGLAALFELGAAQFSYFLSELEGVFSTYDYILFDMGAGLTEDSLKFLLSVNEIFLLTTEEPTSLTDAYAVVKLISQREKDMKFSMIVNRVEKAAEGRGVYSRFSSALYKFLKVEIKLLALLPEDDSLRKAVKRQSPIVTEFPKALFSKVMEETARRFLQARQGGMPAVTSQASFAEKLRTFFRKGGSKSG